MTPLHRVPSSPGAIAVVVNNIQLKHKCAPQDPPPPRVEAGDFVIGISVQDGCILSIFVDDDTPIDNIKIAIVDYSRAAKANPNVIVKDKVTGNPLSEATLHVISPEKSRIDLKHLIKDLNHG